MNERIINHVAGKPQAHGIEAQVSPIKMIPLQSLRDVDSLPIFNHEKTFIEGGCLSPIAEAPVLLTSRIVEMPNASLALT